MDAASTCRVDLVMVGCRLNLGGEELVITGTSGRSGSGRDERVAVDDTIGDDEDRSRSRTCFRSISLFLLE